MTNKNNSSNNAILIFIKMPNQKIAMLEKQCFAVKRNQLKGGNF